MTHTNRTDDRRARAAAGRRPLERRRLAGRRHARHRALRPAGAYPSRRPVLRMVLGDAPLPLLGVPGRVVLLALWEPAPADGDPTAPDRRPVPISPAPLTGRVLAGMSA